MGAGIPSVAACLMFCQIPMLVNVVRKDEESLGVRVRTPVRR